MVEGANWPIPDQESILVLSLLFHLLFRDWLVAADASTFILHFSNLYQTNFASSMICLLLTLFEGASLFETSSSSSQFTDHLLTMNHFSTLITVLSLQFTSISLLYPLLFALK